MFDGLKRFLQRWLDVPPTPCPYCTNPDRLDQAHCRFFDTREDLIKTGCDPECVCDNFASRNARRLHMGC